MNVNAIFHNQIVVHTPTKAEAIELLTYLNNLGYAWGVSSGPKLLSDIHYNDYKSETCYRISPNKSVIYADYGWYAGTTSYTIYEYADFKNITQQSISDAELPLKYRKQGK